MDRKIHRLSARVALLAVTALLAAWPGLGQNITDSTEAADPSPPPADILDAIDEGGEAAGPSTWARILKAIGLGPSPEKEARAAYEKGDYDLALQKFSEARLDDPGSQALALNMGNAEYRKKKYDQALEAYKGAMSGEDPAIAASAYYNTGNACFRKGEFAVQNGDQQGIQHYRNAMANYKKSLEMAPDNLDAKRNIEVVQARIKELLERQEQQQQPGQGPQQPPPEPSEKAKEALARALQLVKQCNYEEAKALLEAIIAEDPTAAGFQAHVQRLDDVINILAGRPPEPPAPADPRNQQQGLGVI